MDCKPYTFACMCKKPARCQAFKWDGQQCRARAAKGQYFCEAHLKMGYAIFTKAVLDYLTRIPEKERAERVSFEDRFGNTIEWQNENKNKDGEQLNVFVWEY